MKPVDHTFGAGPIRLPTLQHRDGAASAHKNQLSLLFSVSKRPNRWR